MELIDYIVIFFLVLIVLGITFSKSKNDEKELLKIEGFMDEPPVMYLFYSLTSITPGKKCRENFRLFKTNRWYMQVWLKLKDFMKLYHPDLIMKAINIDDSEEGSEYISNYNIQKTPDIVLDIPGKGTYHFQPNGKVTTEQLILFYEKHLLNKKRRESDKNLSNYEDAVVYLYTNNCKDCETFLGDWMVFKKDLKTAYPDLAVFEVDVNRFPEYKKYVYKFSPSVYPLILTKHLGQVVTTDLFELYGDFTVDNLVSLVEETFFGPINQVNIVENENVNNVYGNTDLGEIPMDENVMVNITDNLDNEIQDEDLINDYGLSEANDLLLNEIASTANIYNPSMNIPANVNPTGSLTNNYPLSNFQIKNRSAKRTLQPNNINVSVNDIY
jgi:hypothetical protein